MDGCMAKCEKNYGVDDFIDFIGVGTIRDCARAVERGSQCVCFVDCIMWAKRNHWFDSRWNTTPYAEKWYRILPAFCNGYGVI